MMSRGFLKLMVAFILGMLSLIPVVGIVFAILAIVWAIWGGLLLVLGVADYLKAVADQAVEESGKTPGEAELHNP